MNHELKCPMCEPDKESDNIKLCKRHFEFLLNLIKEPDEKNYNYNQDPE
jgi:hypothetical protein